MVVRVGVDPAQVKKERHKHVTSIGKSIRSTPTNKHKRRTWKRYRAQGK